MSKIPCVDTFGKTHFFEESEYVKRPAVYGVLIENGKILLVKDAWGKRWGLPGGGIDGKESELEALIREFREETGIEISKKTVKLFSDNSYFLGQNEDHPWNTVRIIYQVKSSGGVIQKNGNGIDVVEAKYFPLSKALKIDLQPNTLNILEKIFSLSKDMLE